MALIVQKFGGTSVADATKIRLAAGRAVAAKRAGHQVVMVVSARGKKTDELVSLAAEMIESPTPREMDMLLSTGEQESVALMAMAIHGLGESAVSMTGGQIGVLTDSSHTKARIERIATERMRKHLENGAIVVACGFQGVDADLNITTLGRGGSDTTATALAAALGADECEIYTDVEGVFSTDPRLVPEARKLEKISYDEMLELASVGAGVMHSRSIEFAKKYHVPIRVRPAYTEGTGTLIAHEGHEEHPVVSGVALVRNEARVTLSEIPDQPGVLAVIFAEMAYRKIPIDLVVQDVGTIDGLAEISFTVPQDDLAETLTAAQDAVEEIGSGEIKSGTNVSKVSVVGAGMRTHTGVAGEMFATLANAGVNIGMVTTSDIKISVLVDRKQCDLAVKVVHESFALDKKKQKTPDIGHEQEYDEEIVTHSSRELEREVVARLANMEDIVVSEVHIDDEQSRITIHNLPDKPGIAAKLFSAVAEGAIMVDMIVQNVGQSKRTKLSFTVPKDDIDQCLLLVRAVLEEWPKTELSYDREITKLSVRGIGLRSHTGVGMKMFRALADADINVIMLNTSEIQMSVVVSQSDGEKAHQCLLDAFEIGNIDE